MKIVSFIEPTQPDVIDPHPLRAGRRAPADLNGDGAVNAADFFILLALFGPCP